MFKKITSLILATSVILSLSPNIFATNTDDLSDIFVSKNGSDSANGSIETPFATLEKALNTAKNTGQDVYIRGGTYYENIQISDVHNIEISNYNGEKVTFNGTTAIENNWIATTNEEVPSFVRENVYETTVNEDIWQLFKEDETLVTARFPNGSFDYEDGIGYIFNLKETTRHLSQAKDENGEFLSEFGHFYDENPSSTATNNGDYDEGNDVSYDSARTHLNEVGIDELSYSLEGANVVLHMGSWLSWANVVTEHEIYADNFKFSKDFSGSGTAMNNNAILWGGGENGTGNATWNAKNLNGGQGYYFFEGLQCIDHENEWYYDKDTGKVYVYSENGAPAGNYFGKTQTYYLEMSNSSNVTINGIDCFATTLSVTDSTNITLENSNFLYPSYNKLVLDEYTRPEVTKFWNSNSTADANNTVRNCKFEYMDGPALEMNGKYNVIDNNLMHHIDYTTLGTGAEGTINVASADFAKITRNTIHTAGNSEGIRAGKSAEIMYNDLSNMSLLQHDGSLINIGASVQNGVQIRYNWVHDAPKSSIRFDTAGMGNADTVQYDENGTMAYNVTWNVGQMKIKGENHYIVGNTALTSNAAHKIGISVLYDPPMGGFNEKTLTFNNAGILSGHFGVPTDIPSVTQGGNFNGSVESLLVDPENLDFRPKSDLLINNGTTNFDASNEFGENPMEFFKSGQNSVSIGAYEYGDENYMIAGFKDEKASVPIPKDNGTKADTEFDLMWLSAYNSTDNRVYFGTNPENLQVKSTQTNNICSFTAEDELELNQTYYWRVDSFVDGKWITGDVWSFETIPNIANVSSISQLENALLDNSIDVINVTSDITSNVDISRTESVEINLNSSAITGNVSINSDAYAVTINGDRGIIGDISINSPKSTVNINTPVTGDVNIANVFSFFNSSTANAVNVNGKGNIQSENPIFINTTERIDLVGDIGDVIFGEFSGVYPFTKAIVYQIDTITGLDEQITDKYNGIQLEILPKSIDIPVTLDKTFEKLTISRPSTVNGGNISRVDIKADGNINSSVETTNILTKDIEFTNQGTIDILNSGVNFAIENLGTINQINLTANNLIITVLGENVPIFYTNLDPATIKIVDENGDEIIGAKVYKVLSAPQNLVGLAPTSQGGKGKISGITTEMEFSSDNGETYTKITDTDMGFDVGEYLVRFAETEHNLSSEATLVTIGEFNQLLYDEILAEMQKYYDNATIPNTVLKGEDVQDYVILLDDGASASNEISKNPSTVSNDLLTVKNGKLTLTDIVLKDAMDNTLDVSITFEKNGMILTKNVNVTIEKSEKGLIDITNEQINTISGLNSEVLDNEIIITGESNVPQIKTELYLPTGITARLATNVALQANTKWTIDGTLYIDKMMNDKSKTENFGTNGQLIFASETSSYRVIDKTAIGEYQGSLGVLTLDDSSEIILSSDKQTITISKGTVKIPAGKTLTLGDVSDFNSTEIDKGNLTIKNLVINDDASIKVNGTFDYNGRNFTGNGTILVGNGTIIGEVETLSLSSVIEKQSGNINYSSTDSLTISITEKSLSSGDVFKLNAQTKPNNDEVIWSSSDENVATVDENGSVTAISSGFAIITAKKAHNSEKYATCYIEVIGSSVRPRPNDDDLVENNQNIEIEETETPLTDGEKLKFTDISEHWAKNAIEYVVENELMNGISETEFAPNLEMSRAMIWTVLYRLDGNTDETGDIWYEKAMAWAVENEISDGTNPMDSITREQLITMLWRDAGEPVSEYDLSGYTDLSDVNDYAKVAFAWAVENGYISGKAETLLAPKDTATRAEVATILTRILDK